MVEGRIAALDLPLETLPELQEDGTQRSAEDINAALTLMTMIGGFGERLQVEVPEEAREPVQWVGLVLLEGVGMHWDHVQREQWAQSWWEERRVRWRAAWLEGVLAQLRREACAMQIVDKGVREETLKTLAE